MKVRFVAMAANDLPYDSRQMLLPEAIRSRTVCPEGTQSPTMLQAVKDHLACCPNKHDGASPGRWGAQAPDIKEQAAATGRRRGTVRRLRAPPPWARSIFDRAPYALPPGLLAVKCRTRQLRPSPASPGRSTKALLGVAQLRYSAGMKTAQLPAVRVTPAVREEIEGALREGESLSEFVEASALKEARRRRAQEEFLARGRASFEQAMRSGVTHPADEALAKMRAQVKASMDELRRKLAAGRR
ncbi:YlcI/YnfO family protein [Caldimonas aquatica]|uniref:DUF1778 domain-containing protein n=1 Tax=Caldimonas aquatica TaxID=376175 RepID=A0ABY6MNU0_9BURK|nr:YlcI/YnfO family protein [Schlegelella aquatica]UZD53604.1 hypothetical protein OMP39_07760 [Schlegelella aquatica]